MNDEQELRLHMAALSYRCAGITQAELFWQELVSVVNDLMAEEADAAKDYEKRHVWTD